MGYGIWGLITGDAKRMTTTLATVAPALKRISKSPFFSRLNKCIILNRQNFLNKILCTKENNVYLYGMKYDSDKLATDVVNKRQIENRLSMRDVALLVGVSVRTIHKAETRKGLSAESLTKICNWLEVSPGAYFKQETE